MESKVELSSQSRIESNVSSYVIWSYQFNYDDTHLQIRVIKSGIKSELCSQSRIESNVSSYDIWSYQFNYDDTHLQIRVIKSGVKSGIEFGIDRRVQRRVQSRRRASFAWRKSGGTTNQRILKLLQTMPLAA